eukprot:31427-Pelagococcus_subviridis.AAC.2
MKLQPLPTTSRSFTACVTMFAAYPSMTAIDPRDAVAEKSRGHDRALEQRARVHVHAQARFRSRVQIHDGVVDHDVFVDRADDLRSVAEGGVHPRRYRRRVRDELRRGHGVVRVPVPEENLDSTTVEPHVHVRGVAGRALAIDQLRDRLLRHLELVIIERRHTRFVDFRSPASPSSARHAISSSSGYIPDDADSRSDPTAAVTRAARDASSRRYPASTASGSFSTTSQATHFSDVFRPASDSNRTRATRREGNCPYGRLASSSFHSSRSVVASASCSHPRHPALSGHRLDSASASAGVSPFA